MKFEGQPWRRMLVGQSAAMQDVVRTIELLACRRCTVLITGETGTGKEVAARAIHQASDRAHKPFIALNCSAIPEHLLEAELFGHTKGAFTGAVNDRAGRFEEADGGTLFLDEIGDMPYDLQAKLLRVLQEREVQRLGSSKTIQVNVRVIAATNLDLLERVSQRQFREDLYYRLNVVPVKMPSLADRRHDIMLLARHFVTKICRMEDIPVKEIYNETLDHLMSYAWPGNVRQLENLVERAVVISGRQAVSDARRLPASRGRSSPGAEPHGRFDRIDSGSRSGFRADRQPVREKSSRSSPGTLQRQQDDGRRSASSQAHALCLQVAGDVEVLAGIVALALYGF